VFAVAGLFGALWLTLYLILPRSSELHAFAFATIAAAVWLPCLNGARRAIPPLFGPALASAIGAGLGVVLLSAIQAWLRVLPGGSKAPLILLELAAVVFAVTTVWWWAVDRGRGATRRVMLVGTDDCPAEVAAELAHNGSGAFEVVGTVQVDACVESATRSNGTAGLSEFSRLLEAQRPDLVIVTDDSSCGAAIGPMLDLGDASPRIIGLAGFFEHAFGCVPVHRLSASWFMSLLHLRQPPHSRLTKRVFDVVGASFGLVAIAPLLTIIAFVVRRTPGPIIYRQIRVGQGGEPFEIYKFRTMREDAEEPGQSQWACEDDPRATPFGCFLRRTHLDELPQLWNVLRGDMSLVGPRPERPEFIEQLERTVPFWGRRLLIKPGLTGWAQIQCGYASDADGAATKLSYDLWYVRHRSVLLDLAICVKTLLAGAGGREGVSVRGIVSRATVAWSNMAPASFGSGSYTRKFERVTSTTVRETSSNG